MAPSSMKEFLSKYKVAENVSGARKLAILLNDAAVALPKGWLDKRWIAKLIWGLSKIPTADSDYVKDKIPGMMQGAKVILAKEFGRLYYCDAVDGTIRASIGSEDNLPFRRKIETRIRSNAAQWQAARDLINPDDLNKQGKDETKASDKAMDKLLAGMRDLPQLPPAKKKS